MAVTKFSNRTKKTRKNILRSPRAAAAGNQV
jgi:hypothetical protein